MVMAVIPWEFANTSALEGFGEFSVIIHADIVYIIHVLRIQAGVQMDARMDFMEKTVTGNAVYNVKIVSVIRIMVFAITRVVKITIMERIVINSAARNVMESTAIALMEDALMDVLRDFLDPTVLTLVLLVV